MIGPPPPVKWSWKLGIFMSLLSGIISVAISWPQDPLIGFIGASLFGFLICNLEFTHTPFDTLDKKYGDVVGWIFLLLLAASLFLIWVHVQNVNPLRLSEVLR